MGCSLWDAMCSDVDGFAVVTWLVCIQCIHLCVSRTRSQTCAPEQMRLEFLSAWHVHVCSVASDSVRPRGLCSPPGFSLHRILQARIPERVAISFSRGSSLPRDRTRVSGVSCIGRRVL